MQVLGSQHLFSKLSSYLELNKPGRMLSSSVRESTRCICQIAVDGIEINSVEEVEYLTAELEV